MSPAEKKASIDPANDNVSIRAQCQLIGLSRSSVYYQPRPIKPKQLELMNRIDELFTQYPIYGTRQLQFALRAEGWKVGRRRIARIMRILGLEAIYRKPNTSKPNPAHRVYPYLLKGKEISAPNQVWCADITYIPVNRGFLYLVAIMDWATRKVLSWRLSNTLHADFCVEALQEALDTYGAPEIMNTDQGSQFTSYGWTGALRAAKVKISMDGRGRYLDNIFIERLWRSLKQEAVYLNELSYGFTARRVIKEWISFYNTIRPHRAHDGRTPEQAYRQGLEKRVRETKMAA